MPHDRFDTPIQAGDIVFIPCRVKEVTSPEPQYCNVNLETIYAMPPYTEGMAITANARQVIKGMPDREISITPHDPQVVIVIGPPDATPV